jgi:hypothetical protein
MNQEQMERRIENLQYYDKRNLSESIQLIDFYNQVTATGEIPLIRIAHKHLGKLVVEVINHWHNQDSPIWDSFMAEGMFPMEDANKKIGDIVKFGNRVGIIKRIEDHHNHKLFIVHSTDGTELPFMARL